MTSTKFMHSNLIIIKKDPYTGQTGYVREFYPKQITIKTDPYNKEIYYLNIHTKKVNINNVDVNFTVNTVIKIEKTDIKKVSEEENETDYVIIKEGHSNFGEIGTLIVKYEVVPSVTTTILNEQIVKENKEELRVNDHVQLKRTNYKAGVIKSIKQSQVMVELLNGNTYTFYVSDVFYNDIELTSGKFVQVNYIKDDVIYGTTINGEQIRLNSDDSSIKYKNFKTNSKNDTESEESAESEDIYQHDTDNQEQLQSGYKDVDHTDLVFETLSKEDKDIYNKVKQFVEKVKMTSTKGGITREGCNINVNYNSVIKIYNRILQTLKDHLNEIKSDLRNKKNLLDDSVILYLVIMYNAAILNGINVCCVYNNYKGDTGLVKYIEFLKDNYAFNKLMLRTSKFNNDNSQVIFGDSKSSNSDKLVNIFENCDFVLRRLYNFGFSNLDDLPIKCASYEDDISNLTPLKPFYKMEVPVYKITDKQVNISKTAKSTYTEQEIDEHLKDARAKNYKEAERHWQKLKDDIVKGKHKKQSASYYEYTIEYENFKELLQATVDDLKDKIKKAKAQNKLKNAERFSYIMDNLLNLKKFKEMTEEDMATDAPKTKNDVLNIYQNILKNNYKSLYTKNLMIENYNKLKELQLVQIREKQKRSSVWDGKQIIKVNSSNTSNALLKKYNEWFNKYFQADNPKENPTINMDEFNNHFNKLITNAQKSQVDASTELSDLFGDMDLKEASAESDVDMDSNEDNDYDSDTDADIDNESELIY